MTDKIVPEETVSTPYYNDYDETKNFYSILFRPGFAVQARELTQLQTILQKQVQRFGNHIFKNGSIVTGAQISTSGATALNLSSQFGGYDITVTNFDRKYVNNTTNTATTIASAFVLKAESGTTPVLMVKYITGDEFANDTINAANTSDFAVVSGQQGLGSVASISEGVMFIDGYFARVVDQTIILEKYSTTPSYRVGLELNKSIVLPTSDTTLLDPALEASNYQAPGATRYKLDLVLAKRTLTSTDDSQFIELLRVENGEIKNIVKYPIYAELEKTLARRTNDESGSYTVRPFNIRLRDHANTTPNSELFTVSLSPGKAYVQGFEYESVSQLDLTNERSRTTSNVNNYPLSLNYGNYIVGTNANSTGGATATGFFKIDDSGIGPQLVDLHTVIRANINTNNSIVYAATKMGTARIINVDFDSASNTQNSGTYNYRVYLNDLTFSNITGTIFANTSNDRIVLANMGNLASAQTVSAVANAYTGAIIRIANGSLSGLTRTIVNYDGLTRTAILDSNVVIRSVTANVDRFSIDFSAKDIVSLANITPGTAVTAVAIGGSIDVSSVSRITNLSTANNGSTQVTDTIFNKYIFELPQNFIDTNITDQSYEYFKVLGTGITFTSGATGSLSAGTGELFVSNGTQSSTQTLENFIVIIRDNQGSTIGANGTVLPFTLSGASIIVNNGGTPTATFTAYRANTFTADILAKVSINSGSKINEKLKTVITSNSTHILTQGGTANATFANVSVYSAVGQVHLTNPNKTPGVIDSLFTSDVYQIDKIYDIGTASLTSGTALSAYTDITSRYTLDTGQRDDHYDHGGIKFLSGYAPPTGNVVVCFSYFKHEAGSSDGLGYFSVDSYPFYANIPQYTSASSGQTFDLRDSIDFRPRRQDNSNTSPGYTLQNFRIGLPNEEFSADYQYYLARKDKIVLTKDRIFQIVKGIPSLNPTPPREPEDSMVLYNLTIPPYTASPANVIVKFVENKRYTMRDIGAIDKRVQNLEYYTALNLLEKDTEVTSIKDVNGLDRTKNGILVDSFKGHSVGDVRNLDYKCSIDFRLEELRPQVNTNPHFLDLDFSASSGVVYNSGIVTLPFTEEVFITQNVASLTVTAQPYLFARFVGSVFLLPESDWYFEKQELPDVSINYSGENDGYSSLQSALTGAVSAFDTEFGHWETKSTGAEIVTTEINEQGRNGLQIWESGVNRTTTVGGFKNGFLKSSSFDQVSRTVNDRVVNIGVQPIMRQIDIDFVGLSLKPRKVVFYYFDDVNVTGYVQRANELVFSGDNFFDIVNSEKITSGANAANVILSRTLSTTNVAYITDVVGNVLVGQTWTGARSANTATVVAYRHFSGTARSANSTAINLSFDAANTNDFYVGNTIYFVDGLGVRESYRIDSYVGSTRTASNTAGFTTTPGSNTRYSIGDSKTNEFGQIAGTFVVPRNSTVKFRTGEHKFKIIDVANGVSANATTVGEGRFIAEGLLGVSIGVTATRIPPPTYYPSDSYYYDPDFSNGRHGTARGSKGTSMEGEFGSPGDVGGGTSKIICTKLYKLGYLPQHIYDADQLFGQWLRNNDPNAYKGYIKWASVVVDWMENGGPKYPFMFWIRNKDQRAKMQEQFTINWTKKIAIPWAEHMAYKMGVLDKDNRSGRWVMKIGRSISRLVGKYSKDDNNFSSKSRFLTYSMLTIFGFLRMLVGIVK